MNVTLLGVKQRFGIIGTSNELDRAIDIAVQVANTDLSVLILGESGSGKEVFPKIVHQLSARKHKDYIAVNCGAIPEGTIDSELFGHEKGAFTGASESRKGYFEVADGGTIFLDEVGELPVQTQARLLRVLESGEFIKVGSSKVLKTNVRIIAATNVNLPQAIQKGKFREDLYYRLNTIPIYIPSLRERKNDIHILFKKFAIDIAEKYHMPPLKLDEEAVEVLISYRWPGNIRQLKNIAEQISIIEKERKITAEILLKYLPEAGQSNLPSLYFSPSENNSSTKLDEEEFKKEREVLYKILFDMKKDINELKKLVIDIINNGTENIPAHNQEIVKKIYGEIQHEQVEHFVTPKMQVASISDYAKPYKNDGYLETEAVIEESFSLADKEKELILKALEKYKGKRKSAARELGISERTLYRKINEYNINL